MYSHIDEFLCKQFEINYGGNHDVKTNTATIPWSTDGKANVSQDASKQKDISKKHL
jgi:hypothetical protein